jgi:hypothetical protein
MSGNSVGVHKYLLSFALLYVLLMTCLGMLVRATGGHPSGLNILVLIVVATGISWWFIRQNRRSYTRNEYIKMVLGSIFVDWILQLGVTTLLSGRIRIDNWGGMLNILGGHALLIALAYSRWSWFIRSYTSKVASS